MRGQGQTGRVIARGVFLISLAMASGAAESASDAPAAVQVEALPDTPAVEATELPEDRRVLNAARIDRFVLEGSRFLKDVTRIPLAELRKLAPLKSEQVKKAANQHDPLKIDEFHTLVFEGLEIYGFLGDRGELWPIRITVSSSAWEIADDLAVGNDASRVKEVLGEPTASQDSLWSYQGEIQNVNFHLLQDKIRKIEFIYYLD